MTAISVVIPAKNEIDYIGSLLDSIEMQDFEDYEVILKDGGSDDGTVDFASERGVKVVESEDDGPGQARNHGAREAEGDIILFLDSDVELLHENVFSDVYEAMQEEEVVAGFSTWKTFDTNIRGKILLGIGSRLVKPVRFLGIPVAAGNFLFVDRQSFMEVGGFDEELPYHEDHDLMARMEERGETVVLDREFQVSGRRVVNRGFIGTVLDYVPPSLEYMLGMEDHMKRKYEFSPGHSV